MVIQKEVAFSGRNEEEKRKPHLKLVPNIESDFREISQIQDHISETTSAKDREQYLLRHYQKIRELMDEIGLKEREDWQEQLQKIVRKSPSLIVRRESPVKLLRSIQNNKDLDTSFDPKAHGGKPYPNAGELNEDLSGLTVPYTRGFGDIGLGVAFIVGLQKGKNLSVIDIPRGEYQHYKGVDRTRVKMVSGQVPFEDIKFVLVRFPRKIFPENELTEFEEDNPQVKNISRVYIT